MPILRSCIAICDTCKTWFPDVGFVEDGPNISFIVKPGPDGKAPLTIAAPKIIRGHNPAPEVECALCAAKRAPAPAPVQGPLVALSPPDDDEEDGTVH